MSYTAVPADQVLLLANRYLQRREALQAARGARFEHGEKGAA